MCRHFVASLASWTLGQYTWCRFRSLFVAERRREHEADLPPDLGWSAAGVEVGRVVVPGDHLSLVREPHVRVLAGKLRRALAAPLRLGH